MRSLSTVPILIKNNPIWSHQYELILLVNTQTLYLKLSLGAHTEFISWTVDYISLSLSGGSSHERVQRSSVAACRTTDCGRDY